MKRVAIAVLSLLVLGAITAPVQAQVLNISDPMGSLYLSASPTEHIDYLQNIPLGTPFPFYLVLELDFADIGDATQNFANGARAWEAAVTLPADVTVLANILAPSTSVNVGGIVPPVFNYIVGTGTTRVFADSTPFVLVSFNGLLLAPITPFETGVVGPSTPTSVAGLTSWVEELTINNCTIDGIATNCIRPFASTGNLRFSDSVPTESESWGTLKSAFGSE